MRKRERESDRENEHGVNAVLFSGKWLIDSCAFFSSDVGPKDFAVYLSFVRFWTCKFPTFFFCRRCRSISLSLRSPFIIPEQRKCQKINSSFKGISWFMYKQILASLHKSQALPNLYKRFRNWLRALIRFVLMKFIMIFPRMNFGNPKLLGHDTGA